MTDGVKVEDSALNLRYSMQETDGTTPLRGKMMVKGSTAASENFNDIDEEVRHQQEHQSFKHKHSPSLNDLVKQKFIQK